MKPSKALVIIGHGSQRNPQTRAPICACVQAIRATGEFDEVRCGLWKEEPHMSVTLDGLKSREITIVPFFISDGYYTRTILPREMRLTGPVTERDGCVIRLTQCIGLDPRIADLIWTEALDSGFSPSEQDLVVLGHGTPRNPNSAYTIFLQAERLRRKHPGVRVHCLFIDQEPDVERVRELHGDAVMVPLFISNGWHVTETIPEDLGLEDGCTATADGTVRITSAVGTRPAMTDIVLALARGVAETLVSE